MSALLMSKEYYKWCICLLLETVFEASLSQILSFPGVTLLGLQEGFRVCGENDRKIHHPDQLKKLNYPCREISCTSECRNRNILLQRVRGEVEVWPLNSYSYTFTPNAWEPLI